MAILSIIFLPIPTYNPFETLANLYLNHWKNWETTTGRRNRKSYFGRIKTKIPSCVVSYPKSSTEVIHVVVANIYFSNIMHGKMKNTAVAFGWLQTIFLAFWLTGYLLLRKYQLLTAKSEHSAHNGLICVVCESYCQIAVDYFYLKLNHSKKLQNRPDYDY